MIGIRIISNYLYHNTLPRTNISVVLWPC
uniref:Uncharacterized protein n=1 Tax=Anguilla anguilla TaxID=7936 RepID=A0A0E9R8T2_ANGAN